MEEQHQSQDGREDAHDQQRDLHPAIRPIAQHRAGLAVNHYPERPVPIPIAGQPHRQEHVLEGHADVLRLHAIEPLMVAANLPAAELPDDAVHDLLGRAEALARADRVALGLEATQIIGRERFEFLELGRGHRAGVARRQAVRGADEDVVEEVLHLAGDRPPVGHGHGARLGHRVALGVALGVALLHLPVDAALAGVVRVRHRVEGPERHIQAGQSPQIGEFLEAIWGQTIIRQSTG